MPFDSGAGQLRWQSYGRGEAIAFARCCGRQVIVENCHYRLTTIHYEICVVVRIGRVVRVRRAVVDVKPCDVRLLGVGALHLHWSRKPLHIYTTRNTQATTVVDRVEGYVEFVVHVTVCAYEKLIARQRRA